jgi:hypothetical protein
MVHDAILDTAAERESFQEKRPTLRECGKQFAEGLGVAVLPEPMALQIHSYR